MARTDDFKSPIIKLLKDRVGNRCSNPNCRVVTVGPVLGELKADCIGEAAHICAASKGGPRYDFSMSSKNRIDYSNGIWLCRNCHKTVDRDHHHYTKELLIKWKVEAEKNSHKELGKVLPSNEDAINQMLMVFGASGNQYVEQAIPNVHLATSQYLENIDPRFLIKTSYEEGNVSLTATPKEYVKLGLSIKSNDHSKEQFKSFIEHGGTFRANSEDVSVIGTELWNTIANGKKGEISIEGHKVPTTVKLKVTNLKSGQVDSFYDITGFIVSGTKTFTFIGEACNGHFSLQLQKSHDLSIKKISINISLNMAKWQGVDIKRLPYFDSVFSFFTNLSSGCLSLKLDYDGFEILESELSDSDELDGVSDITSLLTYIDSCKRISELNNLKIPYPTKFSYSFSDIVRINEAIDIFNKKSVYTYDKFYKTPTMTLTLPNNSYIETLRSFDNQEVIFKFNSSDLEYICIFDKKIRMPELKQFIKGFKLNILETTENEGHTCCYLEILPKDDFEFRIEYDGLISII
jgi:hypothetical protein